MNQEEINNLILEAITAMSWVELAAVGFSLLYVILAAAENIWCWPAALISVSLYIYICLEASLLAETGLQVFYWIMAIVGWWSWTQNKKVDTAESSLSSNLLQIKTWPLNRHLVIILINSIATLALGFILATYTSAANPYVDSFTTVFSLYTTWMVTQKILENWLYWIVIDAVSIYLYGSRELYLTALLFLIYTIIAVFGYLKWRKDFNTQTATA